MASEEQNRTARWAGNHRYMIPDVFRTVGFKSNEKVPTVSQARTMANQNRRMMAQCKPTPSAGAQ